LGRVIIAESKCLKKFEFNLLERSEIQIKTNDFGGCLSCFNAKAIISKDDKVNKLWQDDDRTDRRCNISRVSEYETNPVETSIVAGWVLPAKPRKKTTT